MKLNKPVAALAVCLSLNSLPTTGFAFYEHTEGDRYIELRGLTRIGVTVAEYPGNNVFYTDTNVSGISEEARLLINGALSSNWRYEINWQQAYVNQSLLVSQNRGAGIERSAAAHLQFSNDDILEVDLDRLNLRWSDGRFDMRLGRQAINLATTFYFTPNDFFAPFSAQTFYRVYKPGVDALRLDYSVGELSQWSLISVAGYESDTDSDTGWSNSPDAYRTSWLARATTVWKDVQWTAMLGRVREDHIVAASISGELFSWLGLRAEGHLAKPRDDSDNTSTELSIGLEHRFENSLNLTFEWFYHGKGATQVSDYSVVNTHRSVSYLAREYTALGASYELTPLLNASAVWLMNQVDHSQLYSLNAVYSLSDESELVLDVLLPHGDKPVATEINSEYGLLPRSLTLEYRYFF